MDYLIIFEKSAVLTPKNDENALTMQEKVEYHEVRIIIMWRKK